VVLLEMHGILHLTRFIDKLWMIYSNFISQQQCRINQLNTKYIDVLCGSDYVSVLTTFTCSSTLHMGTCHNGTEG
jgi:hypothetical protein